MRSTRRRLQTVALHTRPLGQEELRWRAVRETGADVAALDGVTALLAAGMKGYCDDRIHLSVVHSHTVKRLPGVRVHKITRRHDRELEPHGIPRVRPAVAAIRAAHWSDSDRQAALLLVLPTQRGLVRASDLLETADDPRASAARLRGWGRQGHRARCAVVGRARPRPTLPGPGAPRTGPAGRTPRTEGPDAFMDQVAQALQQRAASR